VKRTKATRYSEVFKRRVVDEIDRGKISSPYKAQEAYGIRGNGTIERWIRKYAREDLLPKRIRIETMQEVDRLKEARKRIKELEGCLRALKQAVAAGVKLGQPKGSGSSKLDPFREEIEAMLKCGTRQNYIAKKHCSIKQSQDGTPIGALFPQTFGSV